ncbi:hypothetical protein KPC190_00754 [Klebsiella pneumoniae]|uniref:hypothetical protein n=1 Tax=Klebsiella pneumoniae TaxID=573 RepID=UPI00070C7228|nr:hypothetical protein [Klebsiella pneumoniae]KRR35225.1 hypothetical protein AFK73_27945 [Klebsiella pneumoniae]MBB2651628.1 hypothetical protein [Klebsiella pneumoniae]MBD0035786.1 hypothetical protein [Klebsiella pneumoniae]MCB8861329.1 hypothetical protein [Klebsiella pneumoniae]MCB8863379.1 hypothetical protein [Klebsiella pneumoniae]
MARERKLINILFILFILCVFFIIGSYAINFGNSPISKDPSNWGVLGDYFGGILNPLISTITLIFLIKTYLTQKEEIHKSDIEADYQRKISLKIASLQLLNTQISASQDLISLYKSEMEGVTISMNAQGNGRSYTGIDGKLYFSDNEQIKYRLKMADKIQTELKKIDEYLKEITKIS